MTTNRERVVSYYDGDALTHALIIHTTRAYLRRLDMT